MTAPERRDDAHPYLRAASAGVRHHSRALGHSLPPAPADRSHLDVLHAHLTEVHRLLDHLAQATRPPLPGAGRQLSEAHTRVWQAMTAIHAAFHLLPAAAAGGECQPDRLPEGPLVLTICQRHLSAVHIVRRKTTPTDLQRPHTTHCAR
ncbi:DUF6238 family protein [Streptomyces sp. NPDC006285]|uniref:DUF6238 family protein n=1 Tax=Streptomyces sp. NPDC006285 TaxID=3364742 RepID=UPI0036799D59